MISLCDSDHLNTVHNYIWTMTNFLMVVQGCTKFEQDLLRNMGDQV